MRNLSCCPTELKYDDKRSVVDKFGPVDCIFTADAQIINKWETQQDANNALMTHFFRYRSRLKLYE
jgi:hypothetical protein